MRCSPWPLFTSWHLLGRTGKPSSVVAGESFSDGLLPEAEPFRYRRQLGKPGCGYSTANDEQQEGGWGIVYEMNEGLDRLLMLEFLALHRAIKAALGCRARALSARPRRVGLISYSPLQNQFVIRKSRRGEVSRIEETTKEGQVGSSLCGKPFRCLP